MTQDPVCGMAVDEKSAVAKVNHQGKIYYFCSASCKAEFEKSPGKYTSGSKG